jgi:hypothetical protein
MTEPGPARDGRQQIKVQHLMGNPANVPDDQLWGAVTLPMS